MADLKTNYKDDVLDTSKNEKRKYRMIQNEDGTVSFEDVTEYTQIGDTFGAADMNKTNEEVNALNEGMLNIDTISVEIDVIEAEGNIGKCYGTKVLNLSKYSNVKAIVPISAVCKTSAGTVGILGKYAYKTPTGESVWALSAPIVGTYVCDFLILYIGK